MNLSKYKTSLYFIGMTAVLACVIILSIFFAIRLLTRDAAKAEAKEKAELILDRNLSIHDYFNKMLKPSIFKILNDSLIESEYFDPAWMSSTFAINKIQQFFNQRNSYGYYYKDAAISARSLRNEADSLERTFIEALNKDPDLPAKQGIMVYQEEPYYFLLKKGETLTNDCLLCHSTPNNAPQGLIEKYGSGKSFDRHLDDVISVVSVRVPLNMAYKRANKYLLYIFVIIFALVTICIFVYYLIFKRYLIRPIEILRNRSIDISNNPKLLGETIHLKSTREITEFADLFNKMSRSLRDYQLSLEKKVANQTKELRENNDQLKQINAKQKQLFSIISHDIRSPFSSLLGLAELLDTEFDTFDSKKKRQLIGILNESAIQIYTLLDNLLMWARSGQNELQANIDTINIHKLTNSVIGIATPTGKMKQIDIINQIDKDIKATGDEEMIHTVLRNIIFNALKYTGKGGSVTIFCNSVDSDFVEIGVKDTGKGMTKEVIDNLNNQDTVISKPGTEGEKGTGLGLIVVDEFVRMNGGKVRVESKPGEGSIIFFTLPVN